MRAFIDGDILVYRAAAAAQRTLYTCYYSDGGDEPLVTWDRKSGWNDLCAYMVNEYGVNPRTDQGETLWVERETEYDDEAIAIYNLKEMMDKLFRNLKTFGYTQYAIALSTGRENFRYDLHAEYKAHRAEMEKPRHYQAVRDKLIGKWGAVEFKSVEADDVLAMCMAKDSCIASIDKDLLQVAGHHYHIVHGHMTEVHNYDADIFYFTQMLTGDKTDDIRGIHRMGPARARKLIDGLPPLEMEMAVSEAWEAYSLTERYEEEWGDTPWDEAMELTRRLIEVGGDDAAQALEQEPEEERTVQEWTRGRRMRSIG